MDFPYYVIRAASADKFPGDSSTEWRGPGLLDAL